QASSGSALFGGLVVIRRWRVGYELDQLVVAGRDRGAGMDPAPLLLAGHSRRGGVFGGRSNDVACDLGSSVRGGAHSVVSDAGYPRAHVCRGVACIGSVARERAGSGGNLTPAGRWEARSRPAGDPADTGSGGRSAKFLVSRTGRA